MCEGSCTTMKPCVFCRDKADPLMQLADKWARLARCGGDYPSSFGVTQSGQFWVRRLRGQGLEVFDSLADLVQKILDHPEP